MKIEIKNTGAAISFPYELNDAFRAAFPSAKWNKMERKWDVGSRSVDRLKEWAAEVEKSGIVADLAAAKDALEASRLVDAEITKLKADIDRIRRAAKEARAAAEKAEASRQVAAELRVHLDAAQAELDAATAERKAAETAANAERDAVNALVAGIVGFAEVETIRSKMLRLWNRFGNKTKFEQAQSRLREIRTGLLAVGVECRAIRAAIVANYNRPDRDKDCLSAELELSRYEE